MEHKNMKMFNKYHLFPHFVHDVDRQYLTGSINI